VATAALDVVLEENLAHKAEFLGEIFRNELNAYIESTDMVRFVRGKGLLNAIEVNTDEESSLAWDICVTVY
jgi:ornithine--oxo-acid transaminase